MYSVRMQFKKLAAHSFVVVALIENYSTSKPIKFSPEKSHILSCDTVVENERFYVQYDFTVSHVLFSITTHRVFLEFACYEMMNIVDYYAVLHFLS